jgi:hypothetical protein
MQNWHWKVTEISKFILTLCNTLNMYIQGQINILQNLTSFLGSTLTSADKFESKRQYNKSYRTSDLNTLLCQNKITYVILLYNFG